MLFAGEILHIPMSRGMHQTPVGLVFDMSLSVVSILIAAALFKWRRRKRRLH